jgi:hypothetical protein
MKKVIAHFMSLVSPVKFFAQQIQQILPAKIGGLA